MILKRVWTLPPAENWIVDEICKVWHDNNPDMATPYIKNCDVIWNVANWCWRKIPIEFLQSKKVVTTIHHIVPEKWSQHEQDDFRACDEITDAYHVPNFHTGDFISRHTTKPIHVIPYWCDQRSWSPTLFIEGIPEQIVISKSDNGYVMLLEKLNVSVEGATITDALKLIIRTMFNIPQDAFVIGSFQRDTEGAGISAGIFMPKLEKGPDLFCDAVEKYSKKHPNLHVVLAGWRRQYVINRLKSHNVNYSYFELPTQGRLRALYQCLDLYPVTSRYEGGPQALIECGGMGIPVVSRNVGMAPMVLSPDAINDDVTLATPEIPNVERFKLPRGFDAYRELFNEI